MAGISYTTLVTQIRNYTETDSNVLTTAQLGKDQAATP